MSRIRQLHPSNYHTNSSIDSEFVNILRYLQAAERGNNTVAELLDKLFNDDGEFDAAVEFRFDSQTGLEYRIGEYATEDEGWQLVADAEDLRGAPGVNVGDVEAPLFYGRMDYVATGGETQVSYAHEAEETLFIYRAGLLQREGGGFDYTSDPVANTVDFTSALGASERVTLFKMRTSNISSFDRLDYYPTAPQSVFAVNHESATDIIVYRDGVMMAEGGAADYVSTPSQNYITFNTPQDDVLITILHFSNTLSQQVSGFLMEQEYANPTSGLLRFDRIEIADEQIPQAKVSGLASSLAERAPIYVSDFEPNSPNYPSFWLKSGQSQPDLYFYNGVEFVLLTTNDDLPSYSSSQAGRYLRVSPTDTGLEWAVLDLSGYVEQTQVGANSGVASLDLQGRLPSSQMPEVVSRDNLYFHSEGGQADGNITLARVYRAQQRISAISLRTDSGTCSATVTLSGVKTGTTYSVSSVPQEFVLGTPIEVNSLSSSVAVGIEVESGSAPNNLEVVLVMDQLNNTLGG